MPVNNSQKCCCCTHSYSEIQLKVTGSGRAMLFANWI